VSIISRSKKSLISLAVLWEFRNFAAKLIILKDTKTE